jgi:hypothetical protein
MNKKIKRIINNNLNKPSIDSEYKEFLRLAEEGLGAEEFIKINEELEDFNKLAKKIIPTQEELISITTPAKV